MKKLIDIHKPMLLVALVTFMAFISCVPESEEESLPAIAAEASFEIEPIADMSNTYLLKSTTEGGFIFFWKTGPKFKQGNEIDTAYFEKKGDYEVKLKVISAGGSSEKSKVLKVATDDPNGCSGVKELLTGCSSKTWVMNQPDGGALLVGDPGFNTVWWSNSADDVNAADRVCLFDNEYTFTADGQFIFNNNGTMRVDDEASAPWPTDIGLDVGCYDMDQIPAKYQAWGSGNHTFTVSSTELVVIGTGAHLGLYKVGEEGTIAEPGEQITYTIESITADLMVVKKEYSWGGWKFTLKAKSE